ncbi:MAG TPA: urate hydroxylase PuuD [Methylibium sp.]|uniref:urate hydroxylase PuuD n=1 Tax=Methylibium sp. TaxID=2067992 RepID=UPI002DBC8C0C|nr:urate hydroxylase PuuD [Methylibium sp.]HEU4460681.1 urate hydroxylase PuuD [Methylibium sp.]
MDTYLLDWANLLLRWLHVVTAIAWIGASLHFVRLDNSLYKPTDPRLRERGVDGEAWAVHGGGFYHSNKYLVAPPGLPEKLHWSYWESYSTWLSGFALLVLLYFFNASSFLVDKTVFDWSPGAAVAGALVYLATGWIVYDAICRLFGRDAHGAVGGDAKVGLGVLIYVGVAAWVACQFFAGRAAFLLTGAMLATVMSANVAMVIIPGQRKVVAALRAGLPVDPALGARGKQRSLHNTYFTMPVVVTMLSNHYGMLTSGRHNWIVLILLMLAAALIRLFFVLRHKAPARWEIPAAAVALLAVIGVLIAPERAPAVPAAQAAAAPRFAEVQAVVERHCVVCHNAQLANKNVALHTPALIAGHGQTVYQQVVVTRQMPLNNATRISEAERELVKRWYEAGAPGP